MSISIATDVRLHRVGILNDGGAGAVSNRAVLRSPRVHDAVHALEQRLRIPHDRGAPDARIRRAGASARPVVRLHGVARGSRAPRGDRRALREHRPAEALVTTCAEEGIFLLYHAPLRPGDHAIVETPCYESAFELARSTGAEVSGWQRRYADGWAHDLDGLERLIRPATRMLYLNQPHNPTGTLMSHACFGRVVELARAHHLVLFVDEVYRELEHEAGDRLPAVCDVYERGVSLGSISKAYGLPGLRIGWFATRDARLRDSLLDLKHYTTICASAPSELLTALALRNRRVLLDRNRRIVERNLPLLDAFFERHAGLLDWVRPTASPIGFPRLAAIGNVDELCARLAHEGVLLLPGSVYDEPAHVRIGYGRANMPEALGVLEEQLSLMGI